MTNSMVPTPMFPLGSVFLPGDIVPLRVFEPRYVQMMHDLLADDEEVLSFGTVLIDRGVEVGGNDLRRTIGVFVEIDNLSATAEGGYSLIGRATNVLRVDNWASDDPYPRAYVSRVEPFDAVLSSDGADGRAVSDIALHVVRLAQMARSLLEQVYELGGESLADHPVPELTRVAAGQWTHDTTSLALESALWTVARHVPVGPVDRYGFLAAQSLADRVNRVAESIEHASEVVAFRRHSEG